MKKKKELKNETNKFILIVKDKSKVTVVVLRNIKKNKMSCLKLVVKISNFLKLTCGEISIHFS